MLNAILIGLSVLTGMLLIVFILLHAGRGGGLSDMFGGGGGASMSGGAGMERNLDRLTVVTAVIFGATTFWLAWKWT